MPPKVLLQHKTSYTYQEPVYLSPQLIRLRPAVHTPVPTEAYSLSVSPANHVIHWQQDLYGNFIARVDFIGPVQELVIDVKLLVTLTPVNPFDFFLDDQVRWYPAAYPDSLKRELQIYLEITESGPLMQAWLAKADLSRRDMIEFLTVINQFVHQHIAYQLRLEPGIQTSEESLQKRLGSCRDSAWLMVQMLRHAGLAARFVSGYLIQLNTEAGKDLADLHAWVEVYLPGAGWIGLDPTGGLLAGEGHIPLACTPDAAGAAPISGTSGVTNTSFTHSMQIMRF